jgi:hypothetical protein
VAARLATTSGLAATAVVTLEQTTKLFEQPAARSTARIAASGFAAHGLSSAAGWLSSTAAWLGSAAARLAASVGTASVAVQLGLDAGEQAGTASARIAASGCTTSGFATHGLATATAEQTESVGIGRGAQHKGDAQTQRRQHNTGLHGKNS